MKEGTRNTSRSAVVGRIYARGRASARPEKATRRTRTERGRVGELKETNMKARPRNLKGAREARARTRKEARAFATKVGNNGIKGAEIEAAR